MSMTTLDVVRDCGLSEGEAKIYLCLLDCGPSLAGGIIEKTGFHRGTTYQILRRLSEKGLVSSIICGKKRHFQAVNPRRLMDLLRGREESLQGILPGLEAKLKTQSEKQQVTVYHGLNGIRSVMDRILEELSPGGTYYDFGVSGLFRIKMPAYWEVWQKRKARGKIRSQVIFNEELRKKDPYLLENYAGQARFHPKEFSSLTDTIIYNDTVVLFIWTANPPIAIVVENKDNAQSYLNQFRLMWKHAKQQKIRDLNFLKEMRSKSKLTEADALELGRKVNAGLAKRYFQGS